MSLAIAVVAGRADQLFEIEDQAGNLLKLALEPGNQAFTKQILQDDLLASADKKARDEQRKKRAQFVSSIHKGLLFKE